MDVNNNPSNPVIGERSISSDPRLVASMGVQIIKGIQSENVGTAIKHFPGHGDTATDSHLGMPEVDKSKEEVMNMELIPFFAGADNNSDMIMTAHISYPQLETETAISKKDGTEINLPATLSKAILTGIVREEMKYDGIIITDAMNMQALAEHFGEVDAVIRTFKAGTDIALMPTILRSKADVSKIEAIYQAVEDAVKSGELTEERINESVRRIIQMKMNRHILDIANDTTSIEDKVSNALKIVGSKEHRALERDITQKAITVGINEDNMLPFNPKSGEKVVFITPYNNEIPAWNYGFDRLQSEGIIKEGVTRKVFRFSSSTSDETLIDNIKDADYIIATSEISSEGNLASSHWLSKNVDTAIKYAKENKIDHVVISIGKPYDLGRYDTKAQVLAYGAKGMDPTEPGQEPTTTYGPNIPTSLDIVFAKVEALGTLPVDVPKLNENNKYTEEILYPLGYGLNNIKSLGKVGYTVESIGDSYKVTANFSDMETILDNPYKLNWTLGENLTLVSKDDENNTITVKINGEGKNTLTIESVVDNKDRTYKIKDNPGTVVKKALTGWIKENGSWYYYKEDGSMAKSEFLWLEVEGSGVFNYKFFNSKGENIDQFYEENGSTWLSQAGPETTYIKGWWKDVESGLTYFFRKTSGTRVKGWQYIDGSWRYFRTSGTMVTSRWEWLKVSGSDKYNWKFFNYKGESIDQFRSEGNNTWLSQAGPSTEYRKGWKTLSGYRYFFRKTSGTRVTGWQFIDGAWRYFRESGTMVTGWQYIDGSWRYFRASGSLATGRQFIDGKWYNIKNDGSVNRR